MFVNCSYLNTEVVKNSRQCKVDVNFYKIGIDYEGDKTEIREVRRTMVLFFMPRSAVLCQLCVSNPALAAKSNKPLL